ncbi:hypothetical protein EB1_25410 [Empedobacter brevis NBRC 14943 = ATCC 43319]|uniref:Uncharacterized protein n=1 Tax=Empedobacter brevis NBRC 14943 = ATCC 43319 TaxID=1218108 RepID=A0A511NKJ0_9FLAO|nr:hypothetical protein [Empedobacter brevis]GEM52751.1 hypothetical protein EB1_25410 [Empedobacter brevis NBRC 14943 = ATCC 43319]
MKKTTVLSEHMQDSLLEHMRIRVAIKRCNFGIKLAKKYFKDFEMTKFELYREYAQDILRPYYNELLAEEYLIEKYKHLYREDFCKSKLIAEKILNI